MVLTSKPSLQKPEGGITESACFIESWLQATDWSDWFFTQRSETQDVLQKLTFLDWAVLPWGRTAWDLTHRSKWSRSSEPSCTWFWAGSSFIQHSLYHATLCSHCYSKTKLCAVLSWHCQGRDSVSSRWALAAVICVKALRQFCARSFTELQRELQDRASFSRDSPSQNQHGNIEQAEDCGEEGLIFPMWRLCSYD